MTFIETKIFTQQITTLMSDSEYRLLQDELLAEPKSGNVIEKHRKGVKMKKELFKQLSESLTEAVEIHKGKAKPSREFYFSPLDIKHVRESLDFSQSKFAHMFGVSSGTLRNWEQGRRRPVGPAMVLLKVISRNPKVVFKALHTCEV